MTISWDDFEKIDIRVGTILEVNDFPKAKNQLTKLQSISVNWELKIIRTSDSCLQQR